MRRITTLLAFLLAGCSLTPVSLDKVYPIGVERRALRSVSTEPLNLEPKNKLTSMKRQPDGSWKENLGNQRDYVTKVILDFERDHAVRVELVEGYWVARGFMGLGIYHDYLFFDKDDKLVGFHRRFVD